MAGSNKAKRGDYWSFEGPLKPWNSFFPKVFIADTYEVEYWEIGLKWKVNHIYIFFHALGQTNLGGSKIEAGLFTFNPFSTGRHFFSNIPFLFYNFTKGIFYQGRGI